MVFALALVFFAAWPVFVFMMVMAQGIDAMMELVRLGVEPPPWIAEASTIAANLALVWIGLLVLTFQVFDAVLRPKKTEPDT